MKPMLAATVTDVSKLTFPLWASPKYDGIRCLVIDGEALSRTLKPIPNRSIRDTLSQIKERLDGELILPGKSFNETQSAVMSEEGFPNFTYIVFDSVREGALEERSWFDHEFPFVERAPQLFVKTLEELLELENKWLAEGYEGVMLRKPSSPYKYGRSTLKEGYLMKLKRFEDSEATIIGWEPLYSNHNEAVVDELGHTKRSNHLQGLVEQDTLGSLTVKDLYSGVEFSIASGLDLGMRQMLWNDREALAGRIIKYKFQKAGMQDRPRFPVFIGFRHKEDL